MDIKLQVVKEGPNLRSNVHRDRVKSSRYSTGPLPEETLIHYFNLGDNENFLANLQRFGITANGENDRAKLLYRALFQTPRDRMSFNKIMVKITVMQEDFNSFMEVMLNLNFFSNFKKLCDTYRDKVLSNIDDYMKRILQIESWKEMSFERLKTLRDKNVMDNVLKYSLLYHSLEWESFNSTTNELVHSSNSPFIKMILEILMQGENVCFNKAFEKYLNEMRSLFPDCFHIVFKNDMIILAQTAFVQNYIQAIKRILLCVDIDNDRIFIPFAENKSLLMLIAERGCLELLQIYLSDKNEKKMLYHVYKSCLHGHRKYMKNKHCSKYGDFETPEYERCLDLIIDDKDFIQVVVNYSPMHDALVHHNVYASHKMMAQFGLASTFLEELDRSYIENFLDSRVTEHRDHSSSQIVIDYSFMRKGYWEFMLLSLANHSEKKFVVTHPVIKIFVDFIMKRFERLYVLNLLLYLLFFMLSCFLGFTSDNFMGFLIAFIFLLAREAFQCIFIKKFSIFYGCKTHDQNEELLLKEKLSNRKFFNSYFSTKVNVFESALVLITFLTSVSLLMARFVEDPYVKLVENTYRIMLVITILMGTVELSMLTSAVFSKQGVYMMMLKNVAGTFLRIFSFFIMFIISFTICYHVIFCNLSFAEKFMSQYKEKPGSKNLDDPNSLRHWWTCFLNITIMLTGEHDHNLSKLNDSQFWFATVFLFFFVLCAIVLYNFINGLAINDIQKLREESDFYDMKFKIHSITKHKLYKDFIFNGKNCCIKWLGKLILREPNALTRCTIFKDSFATYTMENATTMECDGSNVYYHVDLESHNQVKNILMQQNILKRDSDLAIINNNVSELKKMMQEISRKIK